MSYPTRALAVLTAATLIATALLPTFGLAGVIGPSLLWPWRLAYFGVAAALILHASVPRIVPNLRARAALALTAGLIFGTHAAGLVLPAVAGSRPWSSALALTLMWSTLGAHTAALLAFWPSLHHPRPR